MKAKDYNTMKNLYLMPKARPDDILERHILIANRLVALELHYTRPEMVKALNKSIGYDEKLRSHIGNLILTYGLTDVKLLVNDLYKPKKSQKVG
jgi:hypothetical protein